MRGHSIQVETSPDSEKASKCQIMFIDESMSRDAPDLIDDAENNAVLTVGDSSDFTKNGGMIRLYPQASKLRIEVNIDAAERANLKISSKLLGVATVVHDDRS